MVPDQREHAWWGSLAHRETTESVDHLMAYLVGLEDACGAFEPKDLFNAFPVLGKPVIEIRATGDLTVLEPSMPFVPGLGLFPPTTIRRAILKEIGDILVQRRLIVLGNQEIVSSTPLDLCAERPLGMHGVQRENASCNQLRRQQGLKRTDLVFFLFHIALPQDNAGSHLIATELMHPMRLRCGGSQGFAIDSQMRVISLPLRRVQAAWFRSTTMLGFEAAQKMLLRARQAASRPLSRARHLA